MNRFLRLFTNNVITLHPESPKSSWKQHALKGQKLLEAARPERAEAPSPGQRPGYNGN